MCLGDRWEDLTSLEKQWGWTHEAALFESHYSKRAEILSLVVTCFPSRHLFFSLLPLTPFFPSFPLWFLSPALRLGLCGDGNVWWCSCCVSAALWALCILLYANTDACLCVITEKSIVLCTGMFLLSRCGLYVHDGHDSGRCACVCVFCMNVGGGFIAYFNFLQKSFSQNRDRWREMRKARGRERKKDLWRSRIMSGVKGGDPWRIFCWSYTTKEGLKGEGERGKWRESERETAWQHRRKRKRRGRNRDWQKANEQCASVRPIGSIGESEGEGTREGKRVVSSRG